jgi:Uri superfamily endonuclease
MVGSYILIIRIAETSKIQIGKLGQLTFKKGIYAYIGSAMKGIKKRTERHIRLLNTKNGKCRWHIDYLLVNPNSTFIELVKIPTEEKIECRLSRMFNIFSKPIIGFGSSDCKCLTHLYQL